MVVILAFFLQNASGPQNTREHRVSLSLVIKLNSVNIKFINVLTTTFLHDSCFKRIQENCHDFIVRFFHFTDKWDNNATNGKFGPHARLGKSFQRLEKLVLFIIFICILFRFLFLLFLLNNARGVRDDDEIILIIFVGAGPFIRYFNDAGLVLYMHWDVQSWLIYSKSRSTASVFILRL